MRAATRRDLHAVALGPVIAGAEGRMCAATRRELQAVALGPVIAGAEAA